MRIQYFTSETASTNQKKSQTKVESLSNDQIFFNVINPISFLIANWLVKDLFSIFNQSFVGLGFKWFFCIQVQNTMEKLKMSQLQVGWV